MFDLTPSFTDAYAWSQQGSGGANHDNNCLPTATNACLMALGFGPTQPQHITDVEYGTTYHGGEDYSRMIDYVRRFVDPTLLMTSQYGDAPTIIEQFGEMGWPMVFTGECDRNGNYVTGYTGIQHCSAVLRRSGNFTVLLNSETFHEVGYTDANLRAINRSNQLLVFHRQVHTAGGDVMTAAQAVSLARCLVHIGLYQGVERRVPESVEMAEGWVNAIAQDILSGNGAGYSIGQAIAETAETRNVQSKLRAVIDA